MCLLALLYRHSGDVPILLAANREEDYARPATAPMLSETAPRVVCGIDRTAGGTWLGLSEHGVVVAVTNRPKRAPPADRRSRGLLCRDLLRCASAEQAAADAARQLATSRYDGCNVLCADAHTAHIVHAGDTIEPVPLSRGLHVVSAGDVNDPACPRVSYAHKVLAPPSEDSLASSAADSPQKHVQSWLASAAALCADHARGESTAICLHDEKHGTVSSSLIAVSASPDLAIYRHAAGPPCRTPYRDYSQLARRCLRAQRACP